MRKNKRNLTINKWKNKPFIHQKNNKGITLIALVVTIVVLLILATVSISILAGEHGIIRQAQEAKDKTKAGEIKEKIKLWKSEQKINKYTGSTMQGNIADELYQEGLITEEEKNILESGESIKVGDENISLSLTIEDIYSEETIGTVIKNTTLDENLPEGTDNNWIILGKDKDGSIMLTTEKAIENGFTIHRIAEAWLYYEDGEGEKEQYNINKTYSIYGGTIQGKEIKSRSITLEDVNRVTGFVEPTFSTYTFTNEATNDYENKRVNFWHPDINGTATSSDGDGNPNFWSKKEKTYENNFYRYNEKQYFCEETNWSVIEHAEPLKNLNIIFGNDKSLYYILASRGMYIESDWVGWNVPVVYGGILASGEINWCQTREDKFWEAGDTFNIPVRPVINLPTDILVKQVSGEWIIID